MNAEAPTAEEKPKSSKKKLIIIIVAAVVLIAAIVGGLYFAGIIGGKKSAENNHEAASNNQDHGGGGNAGHGDSKTKSPSNGDQTSYYDLDEFLVNLNKQNGLPSFLKISVTLELSSGDIANQIQTKIPVIRDSFQVYLRELHADDLQGSSGIYRLREELLLRINKAMYPVKIKDILFREILVQ